MQHAMVLVDMLEPDTVLAPERYDPRRRPPLDSGVPLRDVAFTARDAHAPDRLDPDLRYLVLDTTDVREGLVDPRRPPGPRDEIGSARRGVLPGDVLISRLRPYLRQIGLADPGLYDDPLGGTTVVCSTEFYVLRAHDGRSIAFLVPYLLSDPVQSVLLAAQEGGHHPRFGRAALERLPIPNSILDAREDLSSAVEAAVANARAGRKQLRALVTHCSAGQ